MNIKSTEIRDNGEAHYFGTPQQIKRLKKRGVKVALPCEHDWIAMIQTDEAILTWGPKGGSMVPYQALDWAWQNSSGFGVYMTTPATGTGVDVNCLFLVLQNKSEMQSMMAYLNANLTQRPAAEEIASSLLAGIGEP